MPIANNLKDHLKWVILDRPQLPDPNKVNALLRPGRRRSPAPFSENLINQLTLLHQSTQIGQKPPTSVPVSTVRSPAASKVVSSVTVAPTCSKPLQNASLSAKSGVLNATAAAQSEPLIDLTQQNAPPMPRLKRRASVDKNPPKKARSDGPSDDINLLQAYIRVCESKIHLLTQRTSICESTSISFDEKQNYLKNKYAPKFKLVSDSQVRLRSRLTFLADSGSFADSSGEEAFNMPHFDSDRISTASVTNVYNPQRSPSPVLRQSAHLPVQQQKVATPKSYHILPRPIAIFSDPVDNIEGIDFNSDFSDTNGDIEVIETNIDPQSAFQSNIDEARRVIREQRALPRQQYPQLDDNEEEDDFGEGLMDGLRTPTQERGEEDYTNLSGFIDDDGSQPARHIDEISVDESYVFTQTQARHYASDTDDDNDNENTYHTPEDVLEDIKLSQDVATKFGIKYENAPSEIDLIVDEEPQTDGGMDDDDDLEEIDEADFTTQFNQEREMNTDVIELISEGEEDDGDLFEMTKPAPVFNSTPIDTICSSTILPDPMPQIIPAGMDSDFSDDDDELIQLISANSNKGSGPTSQRAVVSGSEPFINDVYTVLNRVFNLKGFRPNQLEAITSTLIGKDVFVLMPTGGGKSLCYQLPALIKSGKTRGVTIVVSPLISLMQDQVQHLLAKDIKAGMISSKGTHDEKKATLDLFRNCLLDLVYLSPEMINSSQQIQRIITTLYNNNQLARVVVDEAHCVSSWGHDFRPDYKGMNIFKRNYPRVPIMALTATANDKVRMDIVHHLQMENPELLKQSFNRTNLFYEIKWKSANFLESIKDYIVKNHKDKTGIIYCHSKQSCEQTSQKLNDWGIKSSFYHAGMAPNDRYQIQTLWQQNKLQLICATIAFGMGIDKPDVRFVIHLFLPRTLEGYYQETGRAGRDGKHSECIMLYSYKDARFLQSMIQRDEELDREGKENHLAKLRQVVQYCENTTDCRRKQVLHYFNELFDPLNCQKQCDNCKNSSSTKSVVRDVTDHCKNIINMVQLMEGDKVTVLHCQDVYKGSSYSKIMKMGHNTNPFHGKGKDLEKTDVERIFFYLLSEDCLTEYQVMKGGFASNYVRLGALASQVTRGNKKITISFSEGSRSRTSGTSSGTKLTASAMNAVNGNTNISNFRFTESFVSAKELQQQSSTTLTRIVLGTNTFGNEIDASNRDQIEHAYNELNNIRIQMLSELGYGIANNFLHDTTLKDMAIKVPTNKKDFSKLQSITKDQLDHFGYFKKVLAALSRERKKESLTQDTSTTSASNTSAQINQSQLDQSILDTLRNTYSQATPSVAPVAVSSRGRGGFNRYQRGGRGGLRLYKKSSHRLSGPSGAAKARAMPL